MKENPILEKSFAFALRIIRLYRYLVEEKKEFVLSKELLTSGTNIGKHVTAAVNAESRTMFTSEMGVARRKASETQYWLQLIYFAELITEKEYDSMEDDRSELFKILTSITITSAK